ncbi:ABC transporter ATP-binding protein [Aliiglaciecola sp. CAU 1673]|uniref:ABC transporter ATP-binding protein n=1 Tax=Aliiglaciecola sp. CAU 1673 TaxID=3032595 RepID=UPI0023DB7299|nr:ABC transporter ATP-binding protein [Aliiglaciecola sp. CAU 1673]MDF2177165.1 ABC transporter ATP-binding protein [Aliiglaciecola sp. CAU 1673]
MLKIDGLCLAYGQHQVVSDVSFAIPNGGIGCLLGPSGCGKSSILRAIAGFERPVAGEILLHERLVTSNETMLAPEKRRIGMVFQDFALFPHLTVAQNVSFGLKDKGSGASQARVEQLLEMVGMQSLGKRYSHALSGGQQQRVALARALAPKPDLLLLDEPFSGLDLELRESLASQVRDILKLEGISALLVTHDQNEAFAIADEIGVLHQGRLQQWGSAQALYERPANSMVAGFVGKGTLLPLWQESGAWHCVLGGLGNKDIQKASVCLVRPEDVLMGDDGVPATIVSISYQGAQSLCRVALEDGTELLIRCHGRQFVQIGQAVNLTLNKTDLTLLA